jgi:hypothetical protein
VISTASTSAVPAVSPAAVHTPREEDEAVAASAVDACVPGVAAEADGVDFGSRLSGGTSVPTGCAVGAALKPQSSSEAAWR